MKRSKNTRRYSWSLPGLLADEGGAVVVIVAVVLAVLIGFAGIVIDLGHLFVVRSTLQNAADSASLAAAASLSYGPDEARNQAQLLAQHHAVDGTPVTLVLADIELGNWDEGSKTFSVLSPDQEASANSVRVMAQRSTVRNNAISLFFMRIYGHETSDVRAMAVAYAQSGLCGGIIGEKKVTLNSSATTDSYSGVYSPATAKDNGDVCSCGDIELNESAGVNGDAHAGENHEVILNKSSYVTGLTDQGGCPVLADVELGNVEYTNSNGNIPEMTDKGKNPFPNPKSPYDLKLINADSLTLPGGEYYFTSVDLGNAATLQVDGPTVMYVTGTFSVSNANIINPSQIPENLIIMASSTKKKDDVQLHHNVDFHGIIYAPDVHVELNSSVDFYGVIMGEEVTLNSSVAVHYDESLDDMDLVVNGVKFASGGTVSSTLVQ